MLERLTTKEAKEIYNAFCESDNTRVLFNVLGLEWIDTNEESFLDDLYKDHTEESKRKRYEYDRKTQLTNQLNIETATEFFEIMTSLFQKEVIANRIRIENKYGKDTDVQVQNSER